MKRIFCSLLVLFAVSGFTKGNKIKSTTPKRAIITVPERQVQEASFVDGERKLVDVIIPEEKFVVYILKFKAPLIVYPLYKPRKDLDKYSWLRALLVGHNDYALHLKREEVQKCVEREITDEVYAGFLEHMKIKRKCVLETQKDYFSGLYAKVTTAVLCKNKKGVKTISFLLEHKYEDGRESPSSSFPQSRLRFKDGNWKVPNDDSDRWNCVKINDCVEQAVKLFEQGKLRPLPISSLK